MDEIPYENTTATDLAEPPRLRPEEPASPPAPKKESGPSERGAVAVLLGLAAVVSIVAVAMGLQWQSFAQGFDIQAGFAPYPTPALMETTQQPTLRRAQVGGGVSLEVLPRPRGEALSLQEIYRKVSPSIVSIQTEQERGYSEGTGVLMSADGYLITNEHVIRGGSRADVTLADGRSFEALLVGSDADTDLAVLKISAAGLFPAEFGDSDVMEVGDAVAAIGNPLGSQLPGSSTMTDGILSAVNRDMNVNGSPMTLLQTTAALNSGNSGGALVNDMGQVIGITNMKLVDRGFSAPIEGLGFAIPTTVAKEVADALMEYGYVTGRPMLGFTVRPADPEELDRANMDHGLYVSIVNQGSDARKKGIREGDILLAADGNDLYTNADLIEAKAELGVGDSLDLVLVRGTRQIEVSIELVEQYELGED